MRDFAIKTGPATWNFDANKGPFDEYLIVLVCFAKSVEDTYIPVVLAKGRLLFMICQFLMQPKCLLAPNINIYGNRNRH